MTVLSSKLDVPATVPGPGLNDLPQLVADDWRSFGLFLPPKVEWYPKTEFSFQPLLERIFDVSRGGELDAVIFAGPAKQTGLHKLRDAVGLNLLPIIDVGGRAGDFADVRFDPFSRETWAETARCIVSFRARRERISDATRGAEAEQELLAHAVVSNRPISARRLPSVPEAICYPGYPSATVTAPLAESLVAKGLLKRSFFDRMHECGSCGSRRLSVREECPKCRSADLKEVALVHHYRCAALEPEHNFRRGHTLVCPKCSHTLRNYGKDYDKPGQVQYCRSCSETTSEPEVGFVCLDCNQRTDGQHAARVDIASYELTDQAAAYLQRRAVKRALAHLPASLLHAVDNEPRPVGVPLTVVQVAYRAREALTGTAGALHFERTRTLFVECLANRLDDLGSIHLGTTQDYVLLNRRDRISALRLIALVKEAEAVLSDKLQPALQLVQLGRTRR
jgi:hypothetical protein